MARALVIFTLGLGLSTLACHSDGGSAKPGVSPGSTGGSGGSVAGSGGAGGSGGTGGTIVGAGGTGGVSGSGGSGGNVPPPADASSASRKDGPVPSPADAMSMDAPAPSGDGGDPGGNPYPGKPSVRICPKDWNQQKCCAFLCSCVMDLCSDSPMDKPRIPGCMSMCMGLTDARARCQVYHCYESKSPSGIKDHDSHCGHATGRVGGGGCPPAIYQ
jgi:hypothetical protein